jgi:tetratricopeptide (TPR) repeat protein
VQVHLCGGVEDAEVAKTQRALAIALQSVGRFGEAQKNFTQSLTICTSIYGEMNDDVATGYFDIGGLLTRWRQFDLPIKCFSRSLEIFEELYGKRSRRIAFVLSDVGDVLLGHGYVHEAMEKFEAATRIFVHLIGDDNCNIQEYVHVANDWTCTQVKVVKFGNH